MTKLALADAPSPNYPRRWLLSAPLWGMAAGVWLLLHGDDTLVGRWSLHTVVLVHLFVLGVLGNAMLGSLMQFLPVAADTRVPLEGSSHWLHAIFNVGLALFVPALIGRHPTLLTVASVLLSLPLLVFVGSALPALLRRGTRFTLRAGIAFALSALVITVIAGVLLVAILRGDSALLLDRFADVHAAFGLLGWVIALMAAVGSVTLPMFQGSRRIPPPWLAGWLWLAGIGLLTGAVLRIVSGSQTGLALAVAPAALAFVAISLWLPLRASHRHQIALMWFWRMGTLALGGACIMGLMIALQLLPDSLVMLAGALGIGVGLPLMLSGMMLEINSFLAWIKLRTTCPRGIRVPGVKLLTPERDKWIVLGAHLASAISLPAATLWSDLAPLAGATLFLAHGASLICLIACQNRAQRFLRAHAGAMPRSS